MNKNPLKNRQFLDKLLRKMFKMVGQKYTKSFVKQEKWYQQYTWNREQEDEFRQYFIKQYTKFFKISKKMAARDFEWFNLCHGWIRNDL